MSFTPTTTTTMTSPNATTPPPRFSLPPIVGSPLPPIVGSPCAACKTLRRRCDEKCFLAPYFPPSEPLKFITVHQVFGSKNIVKMLRELPECQRTDAVSSMVYEADARIKDPVYGCARIIFQLHKQVNELQRQLAHSQAEQLNMQLQQETIAAKVTPNSPQPQSFNNIMYNPENSEPWLGFSEDMSMYGAIVDMNDGGSMANKMETTSKHTIDYGKEEVLNRANPVDFKDQGNILK